MNNKIYHSQSDVSQEEPGSNIYQIKSDRVQYTSSKLGSNF